MWIKSKVGGSVPSRLASASGARRTVFPAYPRCSRHPAPRHYARESIDLLTSNVAKAPLCGDQLRRYAEPLGNLEPIVWKNAYLDGRACCYQAVQVSVINEC